VESLRVYVARVTHKLQDLINPFIGPEPACGIPNGAAKKAVRDWSNRNHKKYWESITGLK
jgi:hypothetical protein